MESKLTDDFYFVGPEDQ
jgi:hypothetical protein